MSIPSGDFVSKDGESLCDTVAAGLEGYEVHETSTIILGTRPYAKCYLWMPEQCASYNTCRRIYTFSIMGVTDLYGLKGENTEEYSNCPVADPVDPVTGNSIQLVKLLNIDSIHPMNFNLYYNSLDIQRWRADFTNSVVLTTNPNTKRYNFANNINVDVSDGFGLGPIPVESPSSLGYPGTSASGFIAGLKNTDNFSAGYGSPESACQAGWGPYSRRFKYSWLTGSTAELSGESSCNIYDVSGQHRLTLSIYSFYQGSSGSVAQSITNYLRFTRANGTVEIFKNDGGEWVNKSHTGSTVNEIVIPGTGLEYELNTVNDTVERYGMDGRLQSITFPDGFVQTLVYDSNTLKLIQVNNTTGESLNFSYETFGEDDEYLRLSSITDHINRVWVISYNAEGMLETISNPDSTTKQLHYENQDDTGLLTGITDERGIRYANWTFDDKGRVSSNAMGPDSLVDLTFLNYDMFNGKTTVTETRRSADGSSVLDINRTYNTQSSSARPLVSEVSSPNCPGCTTSDISFKQDSITGYPEARIEHGIRTEFSDYDNKGNPGTVIEAVGTPEQRSTDYTYDSRFKRKVTTITESSVFSGHSRVTTRSYDDHANLLTESISGYTPDGTPVSRTTSFEYNGPYHQLTRLDGPRTDVADIFTLQYYADNATQGNNRARLRSILGPQALSLRSDMTYSATGKITSETRINNLTLGYGYYPDNDRLETLTETDLSTNNTRITRWTYLPTGEVESVTVGYNTPDATTISLGYDTSRRLTRISDGLGAYVEYVLDSSGNVEQENHHDANGQLNKTLDRTFDVYNRVNRLVQLNEDSQPIFNPDGTLASHIDGNGKTTQYSYDSLKRLTAMTQDAGGTDPDTANLLTQLGYDVHDNLISVTDPNNGQTLYVFDDLGNLLSHTSPDTGTRQYTYDATGNRITEIDAKGQLFMRSYDALNRLTSIDAPGTMDDVTFTYDNCPGGQGKLCQSTVNGVTLSYQYNAFGDVTQGQGVGYDYDAAGRTQIVTYPSGGELHYRYNSAGQVDRLTWTKDGTNSILADQIGYLPMGPVTSLIYGNGLNYSQALDTAFRVTQQTAGTIFDIEYSLYDGNGNLQIKSDTVENQTSEYAYDSLDRLVFSGGLGLLDNLQNSQPLAPDTSAYDYDFVSNRLSLSLNNLQTSYQYDSASNRLNSISGTTSQTISLDPNGNTLGDGINTYQYNSFNQLTLMNGLTQYAYNGLSQRVSKQTGLVTVSYTYDLEGQLLSEFDGTDYKEYIYLNNQPLAMVEAGAIFYIHNDHLATPKKMTDTSGNVVWSAEHDAFGNAAVNDDVDGDNTSVTLNIRFPGQYYDDESGLHYNYYRYYDPSTGRYITSDPIGLAGGLNTYAYVDGNPINRIDPTGLFFMWPFGNPLGGDMSGPVPIPAINASAGVGVTGMAITSYGSTDYGFAADTRGNLCLYSSVCIGAGLNTPFAGEIGGVGSFGPGELCTGTQQFDGVYWTGGSGLVGQGQIFENGSYSRTWVGTGASPEAGMVFGAGGLKCSISHLCF